MLRRPTGGPRALAALALALAAGAAACSDDGDGQPGGWDPAPVVVEVVEVQPDLLRDVVDLTGQLEAEFSVRVRPDASGVLASIEFTEGQAVKKGDVLFRLRSDEQRARLSEAEAERELKRTIYERTKMLAGRDISSAAQLDQAKAELARETARVEGARAELDRTASSARSSWRPERESSPTSCSHRSTRSNASRSSSPCPRSPSGWRSRTSPSSSASPLIRVRPFPVKSSSWLPPSIPGPGACW
jgi:hypothetical protein